MSCCEAGIIGVGAAPVGGIGAKLSRGEFLTGMEDVTAEGKVAR